MVEPISWRALEALAEVVRGITVAAGYHTDLGLGDVVLDDSITIGDIASAPVTFLDAGDFDFGTSGSGHANVAMDVTVEFVIPRGPGNPKRLAHRALADLVRALTFKTSGRSANLPRTFRSFELTGGGLSGLLDEDTGAAFVIAQVTARAGLTELTSPA